ncbi:MAG: ATP-binding protein [Gaiellaceae bacterium]
MTEPTSWLGGRIVGREAELESLHRFIREEAPRALILTGGPGIGKTKLWEAGVDAARERGLRVLSARASDAEVQLSFATLIDLFDDVETEELAALPAPQLQALEVALLRAVPNGPPPEAQAIAVGFLRRCPRCPAQSRRFPSAEDLVAFFRRWYGPTLKAFAALEEGAREAL